MPGKKSAPVKPKVKVNTELQGIPLQSLLDQVMTEYDLEFVSFSKGPVYRKITIIGDLHIPFDRYDIVTDILKNKEGSELLVINGDFLDLFMLSVFMKERHIQIKDEFERGLALLDLASKNFKKVLMVRGNHEYRFNRYLSNQINPEVSFALQSEILGLLASGGYYEQNTFFQKYNWKNVEFAGGKEPWWVMVGRTLIIHPMEYSSVPMRTCSGVIHQWAQDRGVDYDLCIVGHTHQHGSIVMGSRLYWEPGCLCYPLDYEKQGRCRYKVQKLGYAVIAQDKKGNLVLNESKNIYLGAHLIQKATV